MKSSFIVVASLLPGALYACDSCAIYAATEAQGESATGWFAGFSEQYTSFDSIQVSGHEVPDASGQYLDSSVTQFIAGYNFTPRFSLQANLPYIYRSFRRPEGFAIDKDVEQGFGDLSVIGKFLILREDRQDFTVTWNAFAGLKLPTGDSSRLREELNEEEVPGAPESGIHGHDLALGSGSVDGVLGSAAYVRYERAFATASFQYAVRSTGDLHYRYANEFTWEAGVGAYLLLRHDCTLAVSMTVSGFDKDMDKFQGEDAEDTAMHAIYVGPKLTGTWKDRLSADLGLDLPVRLHNSALQAVPDYRLHTVMTWRF